MPSPLINLAMSMRRRIIDNLFALSSFTNANHFGTAVGGGESGAANFGAVALVYLRSMPVDADYIFANLPAAGTTGYRIYADANGIAWSIGNGSALTGPNQVKIYPSDVGKVLLLCGDVLGTTARAWVWRAPNSSAALTAYSAASAGTDVGWWRAGNSPDGAFDVLGAMTWRGTPTIAQIEALYDFVRNNFDLPSPAEWSFATITHRWSLREELFGQTVADGQIAPASLQDTVTGSATDRMDRAGAPTVRRVEAAKIEGRKTFGAMGCVGTSFFEAASLVRTDAAGYWFAVWATPWSLAANGQTYKWLLEFGATNYACKIYIANGSGLIVQGSNINTPTVTLTADRLGVPMLITGVMRGTSIEGYVNAVSMGAPAACSDTGAASLLRLGASLNGAAWALDWTVHGYAIGRVSGGITAQEVVDHYLACIARNRITAIKGKTEHLVDLTADVAANGGAANDFPATVLDRIGTDHLTKYGGWKAANGGLRSGESRGASGTSTILRTAASSFPGTTSPWTVEFVWYDDGTTTPDAETFANQSTFDTALGWTITYSNTSQPVAFVAQTTTTKVVLLWTKGSAMAPGVHVAALTYDGSQFVGCVDGVQVVASATGFVFSPAPSEPLMIGGHRASSPLYALKTKSALGLTVYSGLWTPAEIAASSAAAISAGKPVGVAGKNTKQWNVAQDVVDAGGKVPEYIRERVADADHMIIVGTPPLVAEKTERLFSYENTPILNRTSDFNPVAKSISCAGGTAGQHSAGLWFGILLVAMDQVAAGPQHLGGKRDVSFDNGWGFVISVNNSQLWPRVCTTYAPSITGPIASIGTSDLGKLLFFGGVLDPIAGVLRTFARRGEVGSGNPLNGTYLPAAAAPCTIGPRVASVGGSSTTTLTGVKIFGMMCGRGVPNLARWQAAADAAQAEEDIVAIPGLTEHLWSVTKSVKENVGIMPSIILDRIGTDHMTVAGGLAAEDHKMRAWGW